MTTIGVLGGGQLGRMLALAGYPLGLRFRFLDPSADACAGQLAELIAASYDDLGALTRFVDGLDVVTYEFENVPLATVRRLAERCPVYPPATALEAAQDRIQEKQSLRAAGFETARYAKVDSSRDLALALDEVGMPAVLKTRREGYDGKGQRVIVTRGEAEEARVALGGQRLILEEHVAFDRELSLVAVRARDGSCAFYPLVENTHRAGILRETHAPALGVDAARQHAVEVATKTLLEQFDYTGCFALELFDCRGELLANEMAPRVHNSGHWTIDGAITSQFENHLRAIVDWPLGPTAARAPSVMHNVIGAFPDRARLLEIEGAHVHDYGKQAREGRKVGHVTLSSADPDALVSASERVRQALQATMIE